MNAASPAAWGSERRNTSTTSTANTSAASPALFTAPRSVGGFDSRSSRRRLEICLASWRVCGRPVRPGRSIVPAGVPRCFRRRFRLVWAMMAKLPERLEGVLQDVQLGIEATQRHVLRKALESGSRREPDELGFGDVDTLLDLLYERTQGH